MSPAYLQAQGLLNECYDEQQPTLTFVRKPHQAGAMSGLLFAAYYPGHSRSLKGAYGIAGWPRQSC